ncbi:uncharacterized protein L969DRAFT_51814 [Mixia osmundae IAM 14324]|uniref:Uncharacterized protein n=1 Tax=Mixia osmundae (strain CBS 9802 / IAM 14324 / JCM 22182 / KY 12970) TaxID=764103 RepID=G7DWT1_MIXOS|nr:uncharacterized protein L969DRAFT_55494 [Mixia osmundae IAM 14324]XP_014566725.1 uncharacterized protein L969DRAFT_51814 [Mixia osmundae IAM 14324]KEI36194.1 hypothetical protein L969DRAFT_55494 [Mixia osmundae IAM 14324]KEI38162.1 hypothetical protein L969DRAFT_51814 [Mixia osmundae IAM 14324]GAA95028.1 hypothetical protein E5Q_01683 [Mixia osmundae IAM 14324]
MTWGVRPLLSREQIVAYLDRIGLPPSIIDDPPTLATLNTLQSAHLLSVPFETTGIHLAELDPSNADRPIALREGEGYLSKLDFCYTRVVQQRRGGFCFVLNTLFSALLRSWPTPFRVSDVGARTYLNRHQDPTGLDYAWTPFSHFVMLVEVSDRRDTRFLADVGFGGGAADYAVPLDTDETVSSIAGNYKYRMKKEKLPGHDVEQLPDMPEGYTLWRYFPARDGESKSYWSPAYHLHAISLTPIDFEVANHYMATHKEQRFVNLLVASILHRNGNRTSLLWEASTEQPCTLVEREGLTGQVVKETQVEKTYGAVWHVLRDTFHFG